MFHDTTQDPKIQLNQPISSFGSFVLVGDSAFCWGSSRYCSFFPWSCFENADTEVMDNEKSPSWEPKKLTALATALLTFIGSGEIPSHHEANPLDMLQVQWLRILLLPSPVCRLEVVPVNVNLRPIRFDLEVVFPADCALFPAVWALG